jgi:hypothetical protein
MKPFIFALTLLVFVGCKNDDNSNNNTSNFANLTTDIVQDTWKITSYLDDGVNETSDFAAYTFTFNSDGTVNASTDLLTENGTWMYEDSSNDSTDDDGIENDEELIILFAMSNLLDEISDDWHITSASSTQIVLYDISGGNGTRDDLTFTKQ